MKSNYLAGLLLGAAGAALLAPSAHAQGSAATSGGASATAIEEVIVTARRREESLQTIPVAVTAISADTMEKRNITDLSQISRLAPNLNLFPTSGGLGSAGLFMRGIGYQDNIPGQDTPIGIYLDGVINSRTGATLLDLVEPAQVQVLRGPQGTLFGRNTTGGAILVTTHVPTDEFSGVVKGSFGRFNSRAVQARIDTGLIGSSGIKTTFAYRHSQRDGTFNAIGRPRDQDPGAQTTNSYFFKAMGEWDALSATLTADYTDLKGYPTPLQVFVANAATTNQFALSPTYGGGSYVISNSPQYTLNDAGGFEQKVWSNGVALTLAYKVSDALTLKSISGVRGYERHDPSGYGPGNLRVNVGTVAAPNIVTFANGAYGLVDRNQSQRQKSEELQALGTIGDFDYVTGLYYYKEHAFDFGRQRLPFPLGNGATSLEVASNRIYTSDSKSLAAFAQGNWRPAFLEQKLELSAGVRWTKDKRDFVQTAPLIRGANLRTKNTSFLLSAKYQWTPDAMTFVRYSTGYRAGGFNARATAALDPIYQPEKLKAWEAGFKAELLDHHMRLNGSIYSNEYRNLQIANFVPPNASGAGGNVAINGNARYRGFELEAQVIPAQGLTLSGSVGYVDPKYKNYPTGLVAGAVAAGCSPVISSTGVLALQDCARIAKFLYFPKTSIDVSANYELPAADYGQWSFFVSYSYKSKIHSSTFNFPATPFLNELEQKGYGLLAGRIALADIPLSGNVRGEVALFGDNLTNKAYSLQGIDFGTFATRTYATRRTFGIEGKVSF